MTGSEVAMPALSPAAIRQQLQKRLHALEETKTLYSERAKMFLGDRAASKKPAVVDEPTEEPCKTSPLKGATTSSAQAIRQQIFHRLQQLEENKAKYTERAKQFLDRERKETASPAKESRNLPESSRSPQPVPQSPSAAMRSQIDDKVSKDTQIRSGIVRMQMQGTVAPATQDLIRGSIAGLQQTSATSAPRPFNSSSLPEATMTAELSPHQLSQFSSPASAHSSPADALSHSQLSHSPIGSELKPSPRTPRSRLNDSFERVAQWANATPLESPGLPSQLQQQAHGGLTFDQMDSNNDGVVDREEFAAALAQLRSPLAEPQPLAQLQPVSSPLETVVQSLHESIASLASDHCEEPAAPDAATQLLERLFDDLTQQPGAERRLLSELRQITGEASGQVPAEGSYEEFESLMDLVLDDCFELFSSLSGPGEGLGLGELNTFAVACLGVPLTGAVMERCGMRSDAQLVSCESFRLLVLAEQLQYSTTVAELLKVLCRIQGWNGGVNTQRESPSPSLPNIEESLSPIESPPNESNQLSLSPDFGESPISRVSEQSVTIQTPSFSAGSAARTPRDSRGGERAPRDSSRGPGSGAERAGRSASRGLSEPRVPPSSSRTPPVQSLRDEADDEVEMVPFPSSKRKLHTEDEPIVSSPAPSLSPVMMNTSGTSLLSNSSHHKDDAPAVAFNKVHTLSPEMAETIIREAAEEPPSRGSSNAEWDQQPRSRGGSNAEWDQEPAPQRAEPRKQREREPESWSAAAVPKQQRPVAAGGVSGATRRSIAPFRRSSVSSLSYDDFVKEQAITMPEPASHHVQAEQHKTAGQHGPSPQEGHPPRRRERTDQRQQPRRSVVAEHVKHTTRSSHHHQPAHQGHSRQHRGERQQKSSRPRQSRSYRAATKIQSLWRGYLARRFFAWMMRKRKKDQKRGGTHSGQPPKSQAPRANSARAEKPITGRNKQFDLIDANGDGRISQQEFKQAVDKGHLVVNKGTAGGVQKPRSPPLRQQQGGGAILLPAHVQHKLAAGFLGWRTRRIFSLPVVQDIVREMQDTRNLIGDMSDESAPDTFLLSRLETQREAKQIQLDNILADSRWVSMAAQASKPRKKPNTAVAARKQPLRRGEGRAVHMIHKKPEPELEPAAAGSPPFADIRSPVSVHSPPIQTRHSQAAADEGFGGGPKSGTRPKQPAARRDAEPVPMNEPEPEMSPQVNDHDTDSPKRAKKPFLKRKTKTIKIVPKKNKSDWSDVKARTNTNRDAAQHSGHKQIERSQSPQRAADDWVAAPADAPTSAVHEPRLPDAFKDSSTTAHTIGEMHEMYAAMFDYTEIEVGQPLDFVRPLSDWVVPDIASAIPQLDVSSKFFHDFQQRSN